MVRFNETEHGLILDILEEARLVSKKVSTLCPESQRKKHVKEAKHIQLLINKVTNDPEHKKEV